MSANIKPYNPTTGTDRLGYPDDPTAEALFSAPPNPFRHEPIFINADLAANKGELTEIGLAYLDTRDLGPRLKPKVTEVAIPGDRGTGWRGIHRQKAVSNCWLIAKKNALDEGGSRKFRLWQDSVNVADFLVQEHCTMRCSYMQSMIYIDHTLPLAHIILADVAVKC